MRCSTLTNHALFAGLLAVVGADQAAAQQTPATYCASLPAATTCEVLNVEPAGSAWNSSNGVFMTGYLIKECLNGKFVTRIVQASLSTNWLYAATISSSSWEVGQYNVPAATAITAWSSTGATGGYLDFARSCF